MNQATQDLCKDLALANRVLAREGVLDAFGHVSVRHPDLPGHFLLSVSKAPELVCASDIIVHDEQSEPLQAGPEPLYSERYIHGEIYRLRPDVMAICHHHSPSVTPFCITGVPLRPVYQHGSLIGTHTPLWDSRSDFGDTNMLVTNAAQGASLARSLGQAWMVLMRHHGATVAGTSMKEMVFRAVTACRNAELQYRAMAIGQVEGLTDGEIEKASKVPPAAIDRAWQLWVGRV